MKERNDVKQAERDRVRQAKLDADFARQEPIKRRIAEEHEAKMKKRREKDLQLRKEARIADGKEPNDEEDERDAASGFIKFGLGRYRLGAYTSEDEPEKKEKSDDERGSKSGSGEEDNGDEE